MNTTTFDTLAAARELEAAGMNPTQAEAITNTIRAAIAEGLVTKPDLQAELKDLELRLVRWAIGVAAATAGLLFAALRFTGV